MLSCMSKAGGGCACLAGLRAVPSLLIMTTGRREKDFVGWPHACETWEVGMELRHLRYFVAVVDAGSLTVAAERKLNTSQPSLSRQIRDLEEEVGVQLMHRSSHGIELTPAGKAFLDHARMALVQAEAAKKRRYARFSLQDRLSRSVSSREPKSVCYPWWTEPFATSLPGSTS